MTDYSGQYCANDVCRQRTSRQSTGLRKVIRTNPVARRIAKTLWDMVDAIDKPAYPIYRRDKNIGAQVKYACQRAKCGYSDLDLWNLGSSEVKRLAIMLDALAEYS